MGIVRRFAFRAHLEPVPTQSARAVSPSVIVSPFFEASRRTGKPSAIARATAFPGACSGCVTTGGRKRHNINRFQGSVSEPDRGTDECFRW